HPLDWCVVGAASEGSRYFQPRAEHLQRLVSLLDRTATPVFYKGNLRPLFAAHDFGSTELNRWREDFPTHYRSGHAIAAVRQRQKNCRTYGWTLNTYRSQIPAAVAQGRQPSGCGEILNSNSETGKGVEEAE